jgi:hypothetical protein
MLLGPSDAGHPAPAPPRRVTLPLVGALVACAVIGVSAWPLDGLLQAAARVVAP